MQPDEQGILEEHRGATFIYAVVVITIMLAIIAIGFIIKKYLL